MTTLSLPRGRTLHLTSTQVMGIVNVTPDSFSDGGRFYNVDNAVNQSLKLIEQGASILDIGGESTRPGAPDVALQEELDRVIPVIEGIRAKTDCVISIDTSKAVVMEEAVKAGADIINDVRALQEPGALEVAIKFPDVPVCLMHMQGQPRTMQTNPTYNDVIEDIISFFKKRVLECNQGGITNDRIILDPGFGFGKTLEHNFRILGEFEKFHALDLPLLAGLSRKSMFGQLLERDTKQRVPASLAGALICAQKGAQIIRVHDVQETADVIKVWQTAINGVTI